MNPPPTADEIQRLKRQLLRKGAEINEKLRHFSAALKKSAGEQPPHDDAPPSR